MTLALCATASSAGAATFGSDLTGAADSGVGCSPPLTRCTVAGLEPFGRYASPADGVIVRWRIKTAGDGPGSQVNLRVLHPGFLIGSFTGAGTSAPFTMPATAGTYTVPTRLPVRTGDVIGIDAPMDALDVSPGPVSGDQMDFWDPTLTDGGSTALFPQATSVPWELLLNADVEPDADHDGYGDVTQDQCPSLASVHGPCPVAPVTPVTRCKKKHKKRSASAAKKKKKCRKKKGK
jgi:hypothetical protein